MRRDSERALRVLDLAKDNGLKVLGTRLETWDQEDLLWPANTPDEQKVEYLRLLVQLTGPRKSRDRAAKIMVLRGCPTERLRSVLTVGSDLEKEEILENGDEDAILAAIEERAESYMDLPLGGETHKRSTADALTAASRARAKSASRKVGADPADREVLVQRGVKVKPDKPEPFRRRVGQQIMHASVYGEMYDPDVIKAFTGWGDGVAEIVAEVLPLLPGEVDHLAQTMPLDELVTVCRFARAMVIPELQSAHLSDDELDEIAAERALPTYVIQRHLNRAALARFGVDEAMADAAFRADVYGLPISDEERAALPPPIESEREDTES